MQQNLPDLNHFGASDDRVVDVEGTLVLLAADDDDDVDDVAEAEADVGSELGRDGVLHQSIDPSIKTYSNISVVLVTFESNILLLLVTF